MLYKEDSTLDRLKRLVFKEPRLLNGPDANEDLDGNDWVANIGLAIVFIIVLLTGVFLFYKFTGGRKAVDNETSTVQNPRTASGATEKDTGDFVYRKYQLDSVTRGLKGSGYYGRDVAYIAFRSLVLDTVYVYEMPYDKYLRDLVRYRFQKGDIVKIKGNRRTDPIQIVQIIKIEKR